MSNMKQKQFFKVPKKLLNNENFKNLTATNKIIIIYLLSCMNSFSKPVFWQYPKKFYEMSGCTRMSFWRAKKELNKFGISVTKINNKYQINMLLFLQQFLEYSENVPKKLQLA